MSLLPYYALLSDILASSRDVANRIVPLGRRLDFIIRQGEESHNQMESIMAALDDLRSAVQAERTVTEGVVRLLSDLHSRLDAAVAAGNLQDIANITSDLKANTDALSAAVAANTVADASGATNTATTATPATPSP